MIKKRSRQLGFNGELLLKDAMKDMGRHLDQPTRRAFSQVTAAAHQLTIGPGLRNLRPVSQDLRDASGV